MEEDTKKISFSFKQVLSKPKLVPVVQKLVSEKTVEFISCLEEKSIKEHELVIPMQPSAKGRLPSRHKKLKQNGVENILHENGAAQTLDEMAVQAILLDCRKTGEEKEKEEDISNIEVPMTTNPPEGTEGSTIEDYENVPVQKFGLAMIKGMGWELSKGIGKNGKKATAPVGVIECRPKGMGLGADKLIKSAQEKHSSEEELKLKNGSYVQFIIGRLEGQYGQIQGFDEGAGRVQVKIARTNQIEQVCQNIFRLVTKSDYDKNSKVINIKQFKEYHEGKTKSDDSDDSGHRHKKKNKPDIRDDHKSRHHKTKKSKHSKSPHRKHKSDHNRHKKYKRKRSSS